MDTYDSSMAPRFASALATRRAELAALLRADVQAMEPTGPQTHEVADFKDAAGQEEASAIDEAQVASAAGELALIADAQARLAQGGFGTCVACGQAVDLQRLLAVPHAARCLSCQSAHERTAHP